MIANLAQFINTVNPAALTMLTLSFTFLVAWLSIVYVIHSKNKDLVKIYDSINNNTQKIALLVELVKLLLTKNGACGDMPQASQLLEAKTPENPLQT